MGERIIMRAESEREKCEIIERLKWIWLAHPELRLGQLISNAIGEYDLFYLEDYVLLNKIEHSNGIVDDREADNNE